MMPYLYVDDIMVIDKGPVGVDKLKMAFEDTMEYLRSMGAKVSLRKSFTFASTPEARKELEHTKWGKERVNIRVVKAFKYLGVQVSAGTRLASEVVARRFKKAANMARRLARLTISREKKDGHKHQDTPYGHVWGRERESTRRGN